MSKKLGFIAAAAIALPILAPAAAMADDGGDSAPAGSITTDTTYTLQGQQEIFSQGGADLGRGVANVASSAVLGVEAAVLDAPAMLTGEPKQISYVDVQH
jgi:hypothetical protein